jgi:hypothetical protein
MRLQPAGLRAAGVQFRTATRAHLAQIVGALCAAVADGVLAAGIVLAGLMAWAPRIGLESAKETLALRRARRRHIAEIGRAQGEILARHARRSAQPRLPYLATVSARPPHDQ